MIAKIAVFLACVAVAYGGVVVGLAHSPASTVKLANAPVLTYAAAPSVQYISGPQVYSAQHVVAGPQVYAQHVVAGPQVYAAPAAVAYSTPAKVVQTFEPVEQHGYQIAY